MTCIVGVEHGGRVWIGGDSRGSAGYAITSRSDAKVFHNGPYVLGFTTSYRMGQLLRWKFEPPEPGFVKKFADLERFMCTDFIDAVRTCMTEGGYMRKKEEVEVGGAFLVGIGGFLFEVDSDFQVGHTFDGYLAVGSGAAVALGSLHTTQGRNPKYRINTALTAAEHHNSGVAGPFVVEATR